MKMELTIEAIEKILTEYYKNSPDLPILLNREKINLKILLLEGDKLVSEEPKKISSKQDGLMPCFANLKRWAIGQQSYEILYG